MACLSLLAVLSLTHASLSPQILGEHDGALKSSRRSDSPVSSTSTVGCLSCGDDQSPGEAERTGSRENSGTSSSGSPIMNTLAPRLKELGWSPEHGDPISYVDQHGEYLTHAAARMGDVEAIRGLIQMRADPNVCCQGHCCCSPLMVACRWCKHDCACELLHGGADINHQNSMGETSLIQVASMGIGSQKEVLKVVNLLLARGADPKLKDAQGMCVRDRCQHAGDRHCMCQHIPGKRLCDYIPTCFPFHR